MTKKKKRENTALLNDRSDKGFAFDEESGENSAGTRRRAPSTSANDDDSHSESSMGASASFFQRKNFMTKSSRVVRFRDGSFSHVPLLFSSTRSDQDEIDKSNSNLGVNHINEEEEDEDHISLSHSTRSLRSGRTRSWSHDGGSVSGTRSHQSIAVVEEDLPLSPLEEKDSAKHSTLTPLSGPFKSDQSRKSLAQSQKDSKKRHERAASENIYLNALKTSAALDLRNESTPLLTSHSNEEPASKALSGSESHQNSRTCRRHFRSCTRSSGIILENIPPNLLQRTKEEDSIARREEDRLIRVAASFLMDYEESRPATLVPDPDFVSWRHLYLHQFRFSQFWQTILLLAAISLVSSSYFDFSPHVKEDQYHGPVVGLQGNDNILLRMTVFSTIIFILDVIILVILRIPESAVPVKQKINKDDNAEGIRTKQSSKDLRNNSPDEAFEEGGAVLSSLFSRSPRQSRAKLWAIPLILFLLILDIETFFETILPRKEIVWAGVFKPVAFFYLFQQARDALEALRRIFRQMINVVFMELFLIFIFSAIARELYCEVYEEQFGTLSTSFVSMFQLSTTVVNPSLWMPIYNESKPSAIFFVCFLITTIFYFHSLVLSVVFNSYMQAMSKIRERYSTDREDNIRLAFRALHKFDRFRRDVYVSNGATTMTTALVPMDVIKRVLKHMRNHYDQRKIEALSEFIGVPGERSIGFNTFRSRMPQALGKSLRSVKPWNNRTFIFKQCSRTIAVLNLLFVVTVTNLSPRAHRSWAVLHTGLLITLLSAIDLFVRFASGHICFVLPRIQLAWTFDLTSVFAACLSISGAILGYAHHAEMENEIGFKLLVIGRSIDMLRFMRQFKLVRALVTRTIQVFHSIAGPLILLLTAVHILTYIGMALWGGLIEEGKTIGTTPYYDLNNFNSYAGGLLTMFQVLVVNDWHAIAAVFLTASSPHIVYPFFIFSNVFLVSIILNVIVAFFVGAFVAISEEEDDGDSGGPKINSKNDQARRVSKHYAHSESMEGSGSTLTVSDRPSFDLIMKTVTGDIDEDDSEAKQVCRVLEVFEALSHQSSNDPTKKAVSSDQQKVGFLVCCHQAMSRFGNARFQKLTKPFIEDEALHVLVSEMHAEILTMPGNAKDAVLIRQFTSPRKSVFRQESREGKLLELRGSLLRSSPPMTLFVASLVKQTIHDEQAFLSNPSLLSSLSERSVAKEGI